MLARVSSLEAFRQWRDDEDQTTEDLVARLTSDAPSAAMLAGTALHKALELAEDGPHDTLEANGYTFHMPAVAVLCLPKAREVRAYGTYGQLVVTGQVDALDGRRVDDHKSTASFSPDRYLSGYSWRFYLDLLGADLFRWNVFEIRQDTKRPKEYEVKAPHILEARRYPGMREDCEALAADFYLFATEYLPKGWQSSGLPDGAWLEPCA